MYTWKMDGTPSKRGNETYVKITSFYMRPDVGDLKAYVSNIFPDNPQLSKYSTLRPTNNYLYYR